MLALILAAGLTPVTNQDLQMKLTTAKSKILVGEFTKVRLRWIPLKPIEVLFGAEEVLIDDGSGFRDHVEADLAEEAIVAAPSQLAPGRDALTEYTVGLEQIDISPDLSGFDAINASLKFAFSRPGRYRVKVRYTQAESNGVEIEAVAPAGRDAELFQQLLQQPVILTWMGGAEKEQFDRAEALIAQYGSHPYLAPAILEIVGGYRQDSFDRLRAMDFSQSAFAAEHLLRIAERGGNYISDAFELETLQQVIETFPGSLAARKAEELLKRFDQNPPTLAVSAAPSSLWPPNHKLEPITVAVNVSDEKDPSPSVKLVSITCDDGCVPADDIAGAAYGTDDRVFELRSERKGFGSGRSYTITYEAGDASGNKATATATVTVPHDQGVATKKK
jgi:hypothetical protein